LFANRYTALIDACALVGVLKRNLLLTLAAAGFYRPRWSVEILDEVERALARMFADKDHAQPARVAADQRARIEAAFPEALVENFDAFRAAGAALPDPRDAHVLAAALKVRASTIVTDNISDFPEAVLVDLDLEARSTDAFIADTIELDPGRAIAAIRKMRERFARPSLTADDLLLRMDAVGLPETVGVVGPYRELL